MECFMEKALIIGAMDGSTMGSGRTEFSMDEGHSRTAGERSRKVSGTRVNSSKSSNPLKAL